MADLLRKTVTVTAKQSMTTKKRLTRFFVMTLMVAILLNIFTIAIHVMVVKNYDMNVAQILNLNQFYFYFDEMNGYVRDYTQKGEAEDREVLEKCREDMHSFLDQLKSREENISLKRNVSDLRGLIETYEESLGQVYECMDLVKQEKMQSEIAAEISQEYEKMQNIYQIVYGEFKTLQMGIMEDIWAGKERLNSRERFYYMELCAGLILLIGIGLFYARDISRKINVPIQALMKASEEILSGKLAQFQRVEILGVKPDYEMQLLVDAFNTMIERIKRQIQEIEENASAKVALREKELENLQITNMLRTSELKALQMQMNPHFLFNTLNMIAKTAYMGDSDKTVFLLHNTAQLLRYSLDYMGKSVTLARELEMLGNYVYLQEQRFGNRIAFEFELDERFHQVQVPCLILQPLVENAITHGVGAYLKDGRIKIQTRYDDESQMGEISVSDNGYGMSQERMEELKRDFDSPRMQTEKIGLANVYMRVQLFYGKKAVFDMESVPEIGTKISIRVPYPLKQDKDCTAKGEEENNVSSFDSR
ncbi:MAG: sensor histidine kinase [Lachnospiraceae bacterium]|nr:sensor histidine kinase [Lachnospiraceae bacterium]